MSEREREEQRASFIECQTRMVDEWFSLTEGEEAARAIFLQLCIDTYDGLLVDGEFPSFPFKVSPNSAFNFRWQHQFHELVAKEIVERWIAWARDYSNLVARNHKVELFDMMRKISETNAFASWPSGYEDALRDWVDSGQMLPLPFDDRNEIIDESFFRRLRELRIRCGGWLFHDHDAKLIFLGDK